MRELRTCPVEGHVVLLNDAWLDRPPRSRPAPVPPERCPWCRPPARVIATAPALLAPTAVAVPHPTPALGVEGDARVRDAGGRVWREGVGAHEVLFGHHDGDDRACLRLATARVADLRRDRRLRGFRVARRAVPGRHATWQLFALPFETVPSAPAGWRDREIVDGGRIVARNDGAVAVLAWAPRTPFETWVVPRTGRAAFGEDNVAPVADLLAGLLSRIQAALRDPVVEMVVVDGEPWRVELRPQLDGRRVIEAATGIPVHGAWPERVAAYLRGD